MVNLPQETIDRILKLAGDSDLARHSWSGRGAAPRGYIKGMAVAFASVYDKLKTGDIAARVMAAANTGNDNTDAISWYNSNFRNLGMANAITGADTLRHLFVLLIGLGMRESSGNCFEGRDASASNASSDTAEAGLFQQSRDSFVASPELGKLMAAYQANPSWGFQSIFREGVSGGPSPDAGSGAGAAFQRLCKISPSFAVEAAAIGLRTIRRHWGPINRKEAEIRPEADKLLAQVQGIVDGQARPSQASESLLTLPLVWLEGKALHYLIGADDPGKGVENIVTEVGFNAEHPVAKGISIKYVNLLDEEYDADAGTGNFPPYLPISGTAADYGEGLIDPDGPGWDKNLKEQLARARAQGFIYVELDNPDSYDTNDVIVAVDLAETYGLRVIAKNAWLCDEPEAYLAHRNVFGLIVEHGAGEPADMDALRKKVGKPNLMVWFVACGDGKAWVEKTAKTARNFYNMGVTYSSRGEYGNAIDLLVPISPVI
jgi:hypothetical protein